jgi:hypothetical protein
MRARERTTDANREKAGTITPPRQKQLPHNAMRQARPEARLGLKACHAVGDEPVAVRRGQWRGMLRNEIEEKMRWRGRS